MKIELDVMDYQADDLVKHWMLAHYKIMEESTFSNLVDQQYYFKLRKAFDLILDYIGE